MYPLYKLFKEGEQTIKPTVIKERSQAKLKVKNMSFFIYYTNTFLQLLIITLLISKHENETTLYDKSYNNGNHRFNHNTKLNLLQQFNTNKLHNLLIFCFFECHIILSGLLYRQYLFIKDQNFLLASKFTIKEYLFFVLIAMYSQIYGVIQRPSSLGTFYFYYGLLFLLYNLFTEKEKNNMFSVNIISGLICLLLTTYCDNVVSKLRIGLICYNYLILIPELLFYTQKIGENLWKIQVVLGVFNGFLLSVMGIVELYYKKSSCFKGLGRLLLFSNEEKGQYVERIGFYFLMLVVYPSLFNYYYNKYKERLKGKWDLPEVTNYY